MENINSGTPPCGSGTCCGNSVGEDLFCIDGDGSCGAGRLLTALESPFHNGILMAVTQEINNLLASIQDEKGRELAFIYTEKGALLVWVDHSKDIPPGGVNTDTDSYEAIATALRIIEPKAAQTAEASY